MRKHLLNYDLQLFAEDVEGAEAQEAADPVVEEGTEDEPSESESSEEGETEGNAEPREQTPEENARYAAARRSGEESVEKKYAPLVERFNQMNQQAAAMCQGVTNPETGQPITNLFEYWEALQAQQRMATENDLREKGIDPNLVNRMVESSPTVLQARQIMQQMQQSQADLQVQQEIEEIKKIDPTIKSVEDLAPYKDTLIQYCADHNATLLDAYKVLNYGNQRDADRQQAINQMRGKSHLASQGKGVDQADEYVEVPAEIMARWKDSGKTEKQIRDLYKKVAGQLHLN